MLHVMIPKTDVISQDTEKKGTKLVCNCQVSRPHGRPQCQNLHLGLSFLQVEKRCSRKIEVHEHAGLINVVSLGTFGSAHAVSMDPFLFGAIVVTAMLYLFSSQRNALH